MISARFRNVLIILFIVTSAALLYFKTNNANAIDGDAEWASTTTISPSGSYFPGVATDSSANNYSVGEVFGTGTYNFGNSVAITGTNTGTNMVVVKYNSSGVAQWAKGAVTSSGASQFDAAATDSDGNVYVSGYITGSGTYDLGNGVTVAGVGSGGEAVIVKYNSSGVAQWAKSTLAGASASVFYGLTVDSSGNSYGAGYITGSGTYDFGNGVTLSGANSGGNSGKNIVVVKYNSSGIAQWGNTTTTAVNDSRFESVSHDSDGNIYASGNIYGTGTYNFGNSITVTGANSSSNLVITKYNSSGVAQWAKSTVTAPALSDSTGISVDTSGNSYIVGYANGNGTFNLGGSVTFAGANSNSNLFIAKYSSSGVAQWAKSTVTAPGYSYLAGASVDTSGNISVAGYIYNTGTFDFGNSVTATNTVAATEVIIIKYNSSGVAQWAKTIVSGTSSDYSVFYGITTDNSGNVYAVGEIDDTITYDFGSGITATGKSSSANIIIVKYEGNVSSTPSPTDTDTNTSAPSSTLPPQYPPVITGIQTTTTTATINFTKAVGATRYKIDYGINSSSFTYSTILGDSQSTSLEVGALEPNTLYYFRLTPLNGDIPGPVSNTFSARTKSLTSIPVTSPSLQSPLPSASQAPETVLETEIPIPAHILATKIPEPSNPAILTTIEDTNTLLKSLTSETQRSGTTRLDIILKENLNIPPETIETIAKTANVTTNVGSVTAVATVTLKASTAIISIVPAITKSLLQIYSESSRSILNLPFDMVKGIGGWTMNQIGIPLATLSGVFIKKRRKGVIFETSKHKPLASAYLICFSKSGNLNTAFSDKFGGYKLKPKPDEYQIRVEKPGYKFPSDHAASDIFLNYTNIYKPGEKIMINNDQVIDSFSIALDPISKVKLSQIPATISNKLSQIYDTIGLPILILGFVVSGIGVLMAPSLLDYIILGSTSILQIYKLLEVQQSAA